MPTALTVLVFLALQSGRFPPAQTRLASDLTQLALALWATVACFRAAGREQDLARWFFALIGAGMALWAVGQTSWMLLPLAPFSGWLFAGQYAFFVSCSAPLVVACVLKPDRPRPGALGLAADVSLVCVLALFVGIYFPIAALALRAEDPYLNLSPVFYNPQRLMLMIALLWLLRGSSGAWRRLYDEFALAMAVFHGAGLVSNRALLGGTYRPGLYDLPWALPFLWIALAARDWAPQRPAAGALDAGPSGWEPRDWQVARQGNVIALGAVALVPALHQLTTLYGSRAPELAELRDRIALVGTLLVGGLYLVRQLHTLRRAEGTQQAREQRFRALVENSADAIGVVDAAGRFGYVSASSERVTGYRPDELVGRSALELVDATERDAMRSALEQVSERPRAEVQGFVRYRHRDGTLRHGAIEAVNQLTAPAVGGVVLHLRDVTEQRQAEEERERSLSLLEATLESTADGILVVGRDGKIARFNQKFAAMWRIPQDVLASGGAARPIAFVLDQLLEPQAFLDKLDRLYAEPEAESFDTLRLRDGRIFERYSLPQWREAEVVGRVYSFRDVSERTRAEAAMARLVAIIDATPDFVGISDASSFRPLYINRAGRRMVGLADDEPLVARHIAELHPAGGAARVLEEAVPRALAEGAWSGENRLRHRDGREIPVLQVVLAHRSPGGEVDFLSTIARDISQRIAAEHELRRSHTMAALGSLVAGVAHEVRNPLFGISSTLDAFEARFTGHEDHREYVRVFREQLERLTSLMNDLLEYGKPTRLRLGTGRFEDVVRHAVAACAPLAQKAGVGIDARLGRGLPALRMDERRLTQVIRNLLENAVQHSPAGGRVRIGAGLVSDASGSWLECSIEDAGPGFEPADLPHLFEPFFTRRHGGTGLGLSIVHRIVSDHGGTIGASNRAQGGACLTLRLPATGASGGAA